MPNPLDMVTQDQSQDDNDNPLKRVYIYGDDTRPVGMEEVPYNRLTQTVAPEAPSKLEQGIAALKQYLASGNFGMAGVEDKSFPNAPVAAKRLFGLGGEERYQTWPERTVREGLTAAHDIAQLNPYPAGSEEAYWYEDQREKGMIPAALSIAGLMGGGGLLTGKPGVASLGSGPIKPGIGHPSVPIEPAPVFYSALEHAATNAVQDVMSPQQWLGYLKNQPGVKAEELQWTGIGDWLGEQRGKISKQDVQQYLGAHKTEIKDVTKSSQQHTTDDIEQAIYIRAEEMLQDGDATSMSEALQMAREDFDVNPNMLNNYAANADERGLAKYSNYQLPGGENYQEHLLTLPDSIKNTAREQITNEAFINYERVRHDPALRQAAWDEFQRATVAKHDQDYHSSHWDEPNVLAHVRTNDRYMPGEPKTVDIGDGQTATGSKPVKSLHIEEIQSDWHQQGRKQGYKHQQEKRYEMGGLTAKQENQPNHNRWTVRDALGREIGDVRATNEQEAIEGFSQSGQNVRESGVPDAPFKTSWAELALKRMIRKASEEGYDRISWTPGGAQAARYDLSKQVDRVLYSPEGKMLQAYKDGKIVIEKQNVEPKDLPDQIGKEAADKIINNPTKKTNLGKSNQHELSGLDLKVGGEGMREFYDKMLPKMAEKIGKAHGVKVKQTQLGSWDDFVSTLDSDTKKAWAKWSPEQKQVFIDRLMKEGIKDGLPQPIHYFDLPQSLKDQAVGKGFPLYMSGVPFPLTPVDHDPFKKEK